MPRNVAYNADSLVPSTEADILVLKSLQEFTLDNLGNLEDSAGNPCSMLWEILQLNDCVDCMPLWLK